MTVHQDQEKNTLLNHQEGVLIHDGISAEGAKEQPASSTYVHQKRVQDRSTNPSLWNTKEFYLYYLIFITCVPYMFKTGHDASSGMCLAKAAMLETKETHGTEQRPSG